MIVSGMRLPLIGIAAAASSAAFAAIGTPITLPPSPVVSALCLVPVNLVSLLIVGWLLKRDGSSIREVVGFSRARLGRDVLWGLLWIAVLYLPFVAAVLGAMLLLYSGDAFSRFEDVFVPAVSSTPDVGFTGLLVLASVSVLLFAPLNAPTEEIVYRGYAQATLARALPRWLAIVLPSLGFGLQHVAFAPTVPAMFVYGVAFFVWGIGSGIIYARQRRLMPLIVSHFLVNLFFSLPALAIPFLTL